jgi:hypothetical protein
MAFETVTLPNTNIRLVFSTADPKELTAHLETLDVLQVRRPRHLQTPRCWWATDLILYRREKEILPLHVYAAPEDIEYEIVRLEKEQAEYFRCDVRITNPRPDNLN